MRKKITTMILALTVATAMLAGCQGKSSAGSGAESGTAQKAEGKYTVGISQFAEHGSLDNCRKGFLEGLRQEGFVEGENLTVEYQNSDADTGIATQIGAGFVSSKVDLICGIATPSAQAAYNAALDSDIPVIYTAVTDPVAAKLANADKTSAGNVTGTSDKLPVQAQLKMIREMLPEAKTIGILYTTSEVNSETTVKEYQAAVAEYGFELVTQGIQTTADIPLAVDNLLGKVDCLNNLTDNTVVASLPTILAKANEKKIPVFGSEIEQVKIGCLASEGLDYYELGIKTGKMAAQVLKGEKKASEIPYEIIENYELYLNTAVADALNIKLSDDVKNKAAETFTEITKQ